MALGPALGGLVANAFGWHWVFLINLPIALAVSLWVPKAWPESKDTGNKPIDYLGVIALTVLLLASVWLLLHGLLVSGKLVPMWLVIVGFVCILAAFIYSQRTAAQPVIDPRLFTSKSFLGVCSVPLTLSFGYWALLVYLPLTMQERLSLTLQQGSWLMLAATLPMVALPLFGGRLSLRMPPAVFFATGLGIVALGCAVMALGNEQRQVIVLAIGMLCAGIGAGLIHSQVSGAIVSRVPQEQVGVASAVTVLLRQGGFAVGLAVLAATTRVPHANLDIYTVVFIVAGGCALMGSVLAATMIRFNN
jgi:MFS family permease